MFCTAAQDFPSILRWIQVCRDRGECCQHLSRLFFFFFFMRTLSIALKELYSQKSCIPLGGRKGGSCMCGTPLIPLTPFHSCSFTSPWSVTLWSTWEEVHRGHIRKTDRVRRCDMINMAVFSCTYCLAESSCVGLSQADLLHARGWGLRNVPLQWEIEGHGRVS